MARAGQAGLGLEKSARLLKGRRVVAKNAEKDLEDVW